MKGGKVTGLDTVTRNLNAQLKRMPKVTLAGLYEAGLKIQASAQRRVPVDTGNLKASAYTRRDPGGKPSVQIGFTASYAVFVHENMEQTLRGQPRRSGTRKGRYWDPLGQAGPKFLQNAVSENVRGILDIVAHHARVGR